MLTRRHFIWTSAMALSAAQTGPLLAQAIQVAAPALPAITLPPVREGNYAIPERFHAQIVNVRPEFAAGQIHILPASYNLYYTLGEGLAIRYGVAVGREGLLWRGQGTIARKVEWPSWRPTDEMIARNPAAYERYKDGMPGGPTNPLGARALYVFQGNVDTYIRVHGTTEPATIGSSASNGCFRMYNGHVTDLYDRVALGTTFYAY
ncbi:MAG: L,D-transpeptidase [Rhodobacterales bacterium]|nr:L,D-transpeptidase [Rhodobacterales bacterium]NCT11408.1 L,D-transpeptidase [Rhodobacterales bacterium]